jgi:hypothetical protein
MRSRPRARTRALAALAAALAAPLIGCGIHDPLNDDAPRELAAAIDKLNEIAVRPPVDARTLRPAAGAASSPPDAIARFAELYVNWDYRSLAAIQRRLAAMSIGEASAAQRRAAARTPADSELRHGRVANHGTVVAIAPVRPARPDGWVVVTRETTTGARVYDELAPAYHVALATVVRVRGGWAISRWEPQS